MIKAYEETILTPLKVAQMSGYVDWSSQPSMFKHYPNFLYRYRYGENEALRLVELSRTVTSESAIGCKPYYQLNTPSAGNLHPLELYVQIRGVKGVLSGIYHVDAGTSEIVLIREIESDGIESYMGLSKKFTGMIFLVSCVAFRAQWKYSQRAIRYCYLDIGHQVGAIAASLKLYEKEMSILSDFDKNELNEFMGFKNEEFTAAVLSCGDLSDKNVKSCKQNLMYVMPTDYSELDKDIIENISKSEILKSDVMHVSCAVSEEDILSRRSTRFFDSEGLSKTKLEYFLSLANAPAYPISCYSIVLRDLHVKAGIYLEHKLLQEGHFTDKMVSLLVNQSFVKNADIITVVTSKYFSANKLMQAGAFVHNLYIEAEVGKVGMSGIGAFYDKKLQDFLGVSDYILYVCAIGEVRSESKNEKN